ncbi:MAG: transposase [Xanthomonadales bacterium]|nr:transposase [Xanthomonadales bacterium]
MKTKKRKAYPDDFRREVVRLVIEERLSHSEVARRLDVPAQTVGNWVRERDKLQPDPATGMSPQAMQKELARLRAENASLKLDRDILKKAAAYFAKESS